MKMPRKSKAQRTRATLYDTRLFTSAKVAKREENVVKRGVIPQRGFLLEDNGLYNTFLDPIKARNWQKFCHPPKDSILPLVREFFSNALDRTNSKIFVRGKWVPVWVKNFNKQ